MKAIILSFGSYGTATASREGCSHLNSYESLVMSNESNVERVKLFKWRLQITARCCCIDIEFMQMLHKKASLILRAPLSFLRTPLSHVAAKPVVTSVTPAERIVILDILRGFALLGILVVHAPAFMSNSWTPVDQRWPQFYNRAAGWVIDTVFTGKFNSLFSFIFGISFTLQLERLVSRSAHPIRIYLRRLSVLFVFGVAHALLFWSNDILHVYALFGAFLVLLKRASNALVISLIVAGLVIPGGITAVRVLTYTAHDEQQARARSTRMERLTQDVYTHGSYVDTIRARAEELKITYSRPGRVSFYLQVGVTGLLGFYVGRKKYIQTAKQEPFLVNTVLFWSLLIGGTCDLVFNVLQPFLDPFNPTPLNVLVNLAYAWQRPALMLFYVAAILVAAHSVRWGKWLHLLAFAGRMPLTNYLLQSVVCTTLSYGYGLGLYDRIGPAGCLAFSFLLYSLQVIWSRWYLMYFKDGPAEWLWRTLTYGRAGRPVTFLAEPI